MSAQEIVNAGRAASAIGCTVDEYRARMTAGEKWCGGCKQWHPRSVFGRDRTRGDGLTARCRLAKNGHPDHETPTNRPRGRRHVEPRPGDRVQARRRANQLLAVGRLPAPDRVACADCGHAQGEPGKRHQYDHYRGYGAEHHEDVEAVCTPCHYAREIARGAHVNARTPGGAYRLPHTLGMPLSHVVARTGRSLDDVYRLIRDGHLNIFPGRGVTLVTAESFNRFVASAHAGSPV